jgi:hypothetical protein
MKRVFNFQCVLLQYMTRSNNMYRCIVIIAYDIIYNYWYIVFTILRGASNFPNLFLFFGGASYGPWNDVGCWVRGCGLSWASCSYHLFLLGWRSTKSLSSLLDVVTMFDVGATLFLTDPLACIYQKLYVLAVYTSVGWTILNNWVSDITIGSFALISCSLLVALLVCNERVLI